ncbi:hypothetical protein Sango_2923000 [Sesamum angolense]|uniref:Uncharacterized protein n=1 Tax=Sesamum angolense TaxID=2727404 RepID=A0AAE1VUF6_9LAMI|nr:hypothetical protein Sango_2923000 [Sesamum angolense]
MMMSVRSPLVASLMQSTIAKHSVIVPVQDDAQFVAIQESIFANKRKVGVPEIQETAKNQDDGQVQCGLNIQVIDDTALIDPSLVGNGKTDRNGQESEKEKKPKRRGGKARRKKEALNARVETQASLEKKGKKRLVVEYSRKEMEALRFKNLEDQKKKWAEVYSGLGAFVAQEYDGLVNSVNIHQKQRVPGFEFDPRSRFQNSANLGWITCEGVPFVFMTFV